MASPKQKQLSPYTVPAGNTNKDTTNNLVDLDVTIHLTGTIANVQADWATITGTNFASAAVVRHGPGK